MNKEKSVTVNGVKIMLGTDGQQNYVPIRFVCEALQIGFPSQYCRIMRDGILKTVVTKALTITPAGQKRMMICLPQQFMYGWIFAMDVDNVSPERKEPVLKYIMDTYAEVQELIRKND